MTRQRVARAHRRCGSRWAGGADAQQLALRNKGAEDERECCSKRTCWRRRVEGKIGMFARDWLRAVVSARRALRNMGGLGAPELRCLQSKCSRHFLDRSDQT